MTATDELRRLLDERDVKHEDKHTELAPNISGWDSTWWQGIAGMTFLEISDETFGRENCVYINETYLTPEQAIAATLERGTCEVSSHYYYDDYDIHEFEFSCGHSYSTPDGKSYPYCPNCGTRVERREE